ncbi:MAG: hypothetical protein ACYST0_10275 [Planctomycetota bacterium]
MEQLRLVGQLALVAEPGEIEKAADAIGGLVELAEQLTLRVGDRLDPRDLAARNPLFA